MALYVESDVPPIPDPDEEEQSRAQKTTYSMLKIVGLFIDSLLSGGSVRIKSRGDIRRKNLPKYYEKRI